MIATRTSTTRPAGPMPRWSRRWTTRSAASSPRSSRRACATTRLIVFQSDNGGTRNAMFAGDGDMSKVICPPTTAPIATARARSTKAARASSRSPTGPAISRPAASRTDMIHVVDMYPTLLGSPGVQRDKASPSTASTSGRRISEGSPRRAPSSSTISSRSAPIREGDWKLTPGDALPQRRALRHRAGPLREDQCRRGRSGPGALHAGAHPRAGDVDGAALVLLERPPGCALGSPVDPVDEVYMLNAAED